MVPACAIRMRNGGGRAKVQAPSRISAGPRRREMPCSTLRRMCRCVGGGLHPSAMAGESASGESASGARCAPTRGICFVASWRSGSLSIRSVRGRRADAGSLRHRLLGGAVGRGCALRHAQQADKHDARGDPWNMGCASAPSSKLHGAGYTLPSSRRAAIQLRYCRRTGRPRLLPLGGIAACVWTDGPSLTSPRSGRGQRGGVPPRRKFALLPASRPAWLAAPTC